MKKLKMVFVAPLAMVLSFFAPAASEAQETKPEEELPKGWWRIPKTSVKIKLGGYVKFDLIHDFNPIASPDYFDVSKIPTDGSEGQTTHLNAKETRLHLDARTDSRFGEIRAYVETDFYGSGGALRLRHAFVEIGGKLLAGQYWSNFMDEDVIPATLDFEKPGAYPFVRHPILRYKHTFANKNYLAVAIEEPNNVAQMPPQPGKLENALPDLTARFRVTQNWGHVQLSAYAAQLGFRPTGGSPDNIFLTGANLSGKVNTVQKDYFIFQGVYGPGIARYRGGLSAAPDANGNLEPIVGYGFTLGYQHWWSKAFSSLVVYNYGGEENTDGQPGTSLSILNYFAANLIWHFYENAFAGIEYLWGGREDLNNSSGNANRIQFSIKYAFN